MNNHLPDWCSQLLSALVQTTSPEQLMPNDTKTVSTVPYTAAHAHRIKQTSAEMVALHTKRAELMRNAATPKE